MVAEPTMPGGEGVPPNAPPRRCGTWRCRLGVLIISCAVALLLGEVAVRLGVDLICDDGQRQTIMACRMLAEGCLPRYSPAPYLNYHPTPNYLNVDGGGNTRHNKAGFRDSFEYGPKARGTLRIVCLGGSTTYGASVRDNYSTWPACLQKLLNRPPVPAPWERVEVMNLGVGGHTSAEMLTTLHFYALPLEPDVVLLHEAINDVTPRLYAECGPAYQTFRKPLMPMEAGPLKRLLLHSMLVDVFVTKCGLLPPMTLQDRAQYPLPGAEAAMVNLAANPPEVFTRNIDACITLAEKTGARVWLLTQAYNEDPQFAPPEDERRALEPAYRKGQQEHNQVLRDLAMRRGVGLVDLDKETPREKALFADPIHMTARGNRVKAGLIADSLRAGFGVLQASSN